MPTPLSTWNDVFMRVPASSAGWWARILDKYTLWGLALRGCLPIASCVVVSSDHVCPHMTNLETCFTRTICEISETAGKGEPHDALVLHRWWLHDLCGWLHKPSRFHMPFAYYDLTHHKVTDHGSHISPKPVWRLLLYWAIGSWWSWSL